MKALGQLDLAEAKFFKEFSHCW